MIKRRLFYLTKNPFTVEEAFTPQTETLHVEGILNLEDINTSFESYETIKEIRVCGKVIDIKNTLINAVSDSEDDIRDLAWIDYSLTEEKKIDSLLDFVSTSHRLNKFYVEKQEKYDILSTFIYLLRNIRKNGVLYEFDEFFEFSKKVLSFLFLLNKNSNGDFQKELSLTFIRLFIQRYLRDLYCACLFGPYTSILFFWNLFIVETFKTDKIDMPFFDVSPKCDDIAGGLTLKENLDFIQIMIDYGMNAIISFAYLYQFDDFFYCRSEKSETKEDMHKYEQYLKKKASDSTFNKNTASAFASIIMNVFETDGKSEADLIEFFGLNKNDAKKTEWYEGSLDDSNFDKQFRRCNGFPLIEESKIAYIQNRYSDQEVQKLVDSC